MRSFEENQILVKRIQKSVFKILCDVDELCKENHITYYLSGGTCLGAVRHQGFIPWDDDADIMLPRSEYSRFLKLVAEKLGEKYYVGSLYTDETWLRPFSRICDRKSKFVPYNFKDKPMGFFIDVFPIDGLPENNLARYLYYRKQQIRKGLFYSSMKTEFNATEKYKLIKTVAAVFTKRIGTRKFALSIDNHAKKYSFETSKYVGAVLAMHYWDKETIEREHMAKAVYLKFEGREFPVPVGYQKYLSNLYGDYMVIPKDAEKNGVTHLQNWIVEFSED